MARCAGATLFWATTCDTSVSTILLCIAGYAVFTV